MKQQLITLAWLATLLASPFLHADGKAIRIWASGTSMDSTAADSDESMSGGFQSFSEGRGTLGPVSLSTAGDLSDWDGTSFCDFDAETGDAIAVTLFYLTTSSVVRTARGDQLHLEMNSSPPSPFCFNFLNETSKFELYMDIVGGTGRFRGATGNLKFAGSGRNLANASPFHVFGEGTLYLKQAASRSEDASD